MGKRLSLGILLANWIVGLFFIFLFPPSVDVVHTKEGKSYVQTPQGSISESFNLPETPSFDVDWKLYLSPKGFKSLLHYSTSSVVAIPFSEYSSAPFFDVKQTFIHFFYTW